MKPKIHFEISNEKSEALEVKEPYETNHAETDTRSI